MGEENSEEGITYKGAIRKALISLESCATNAENSYGSLADMRDVMKSIHGDLLDIKNLIREFLDLYESANEITVRYADKIQEVEK